jgi:hypothetical protein
MRVSGYPRKGGSPVRWPPRLAADEKQVFSARRRECSAPKATASSLATVAAPLRSMQQSARSASKRSQPFRWGTLERLDSARREFSRRRRKAEVRRAPAKTAGAPLRLGSVIDGAGTVGKQKPSERWPRRLEFLKLGTLELVESDGRSHGDAVVRAGRSDLNTDSRIPRVSERLVAAKSITLGAVPERHCGGVGLRGRTLVESAGWTGPPGVGSCFGSVRGVQAGSV